ncbi:hypothetical protein STENM327S_00505 [Streptomyces tendae]
MRGYLGGIWYDWNGGKIQREGRISVPLGQGESATYTVDGKKLLLGMEGADSPVKAEDVPGEGGGSGGGGAESGGDSAGSDGPGGVTLKVGAVGLVLALAALLGLRRLFRRR